jgi:2-dehydropantoate 2-reductase
VFLGVKAHSLTTLAPQLRPLFGADTVVVSTQNGIPWWYFQNYGKAELDGLRLERVDPGGVIAAAIEPRRVVGSLAYFATDVVAPGVIHHTEGNRISFGEPDGTKSERVKAIADALIAAGFRCPVTTRFRHEIWVKLLGNIAFNPISALTGGTLEELASYPETNHLIRDRNGGSQARYRAADLHRAAAGRRAESGRAQDLDVAGLRGGPPDGDRSDRRRSGGARGATRSADASDTCRVCLCEAAR